jgi:hypothetical protein
MPRNSTKPVATEVKIEFQFQESQTRLLHRVTGANGKGSYIVLKAPQCLEVGGQRSGKTTGKLMHGILEYCLKFNYCDMLVLRRTIPELDTIIQDMITFLPKEETGFYTLNRSTRIVTFQNGSRIIFAGCANDTERDIEKYLGQAFPYIQVSECAQFSPEIWERLAGRNLVNNRCEKDEHGNLPEPRIVGDTNPIGAHWDFYHTKFVKKQPWDKSEGLKQDKYGRWWRPPYEGEGCIAYDPNSYAYNHTTILDNKEYMKRDPGMIARLNQMSKAKREIFLLGRMDGVAGQYFDCWSEDANVVDLREDPEAVVWQTWQPVIGGQDWGVGHANAFYLFTRAMVRISPGGEYKPRVVCFREIAPDTVGLTAVEFADLINASVYYPRLPEDHPQYSIVSGKRCKVAAIAFSHEKFNRVMEQHSPADEYSRLLRQRDLPPVSRATTDRIGSAGYMYDQIKRGQLVVLRTCPAIIQAIPSLQRDPKRLDDVLKTSAKADDRFDAFRYGLYMMFKERGMPEDLKKKIEIDKLVKTNPFGAHFAKLRAEFEAKKKGETFVQRSIPHWQTKLK